MERNLLSQVDQDHGPLDQEQRQEDGKTVRHLLVLSLHRVNVGMESSVNSPTLTVRVMI